MPQNNNIILYDANGNPLISAQDSLTAAKELTRIRRLAEDVENRGTLEKIEEKLPDVGQAIMGNSIPVAIANDQSVINTNIKSGVLSTKNSKKLNTIASTASFIGISEDVSKYRSISINISAGGDTYIGGTTFGTLSISWSPDGTSWNNVEYFSTQDRAAQGMNATFTLNRPVQGAYFTIALTNISFPIYFEINTTLLDNLPGITQGRGYDIYGTNYDLTSAYPQGIGSLGTINDIKVDGKGGQYIGGMPTFTSRPRNAAQPGAYLSPYFSPGQYSDWGGSWVTTGYLTAVVAAAKAANTMLMALTCGTPPAISGFVTYITRIKVFYEVVTAFAAAAVPSSLVLQRYTGSTPTGGTSRTIATKDQNSGRYTNVNDVRDSNAALTGVAPTFGDVIASKLAPVFTVSGSSIELFDLEYDAFGADPLKLIAGDGIALRIGTNAFPATGTWMYSYTVEWISLFSTL